MKSAFAIVALGLIASSGGAAPALADRPIKWEYADLSTKREIVEIPGKRENTYRYSLLWSTEAEEVEGGNWKDLADKLKAPALKKAGSTTQEKLRLLNRLGADGWELVEHQRAAPDTPGRPPGLESWTFKRRLP